MPSLFRVEGMETGKARQWPEVTVPLSTMISVQALSPHHSSHLRQETVEGGSRGRMGGLGRRNGSSGGPTADTAGSQ